MTRCALYRHYDRDDQLLYVGLTDCLSRRTKEHSKASEWFDKVHRTETVYCISRQHAEDLEKVAVYHERPLHNKAMNDRPKIRREIKKPTPTMVKPEKASGFTDEEASLLAQLTYEEKAGITLVTKVILLFTGTSITSAKIAAEVPVQRFVEVAAGRYGWLEEARAASPATPSARATA